MNAPVLAPARQGVPVRAVVSPGGIEAWHVEDHTLPLVVLRFAFRGGAAQDRDGKTGTAHVLSGLLDEGAGPLESQAFHEALDDLAAELSFNADRDFLGGSLKTLTRHLDAAADLLKLALAEPRFDDVAVERVRAQVAASLKWELKDPNAIAGRTWSQLAFPAHPYGKQVNGSLDTVPLIARADVAAAHGRLVARDALEVVAVGDIDEGTLTALLDRVFGGLPARADLVPVALAAPAAIGERHVVDLDIPQSVVRFGGPGLMRKDPDYVAAYVVNHILGGRGILQSRLFREVREKRGLAYSVSSSLVPLARASIFGGGTSTKNERVAESISVIAEQIRDLAAAGPTEDEIAKAKKYLTGSYALRLDSCAKIAGELLHIKLDDLGIDYTARRNALIDAVTPADALRASQRLFGAGELLVTVVGRPEGL